MLFVAKIVTLGSCIEPFASENPIAKKRG